jgi:hypothetical protein
MKVVSLALGDLFACLVLLYDCKMAGWEKRRQQSPYEPA